MSGSYSLQTAVIYCICNVPTETNVSVNSAWVSAYWTPLVTNRMRIVATMKKYESMHSL